MPDANGHLNCNDLGSLEQYPFKICGNKKIIYVSMTSGGQTTEEITFNVDVSDAAPAGTTIPAGSTIDDILKIIGQTIFEPVYVEPDFSISNDAGSLRVIGDVLDVAISIDFDRGEIRGALVDGTWNPNAMQAPRAGNATLYTFNSEGNGTNASKVFSDYEVIQGLNIFSGKVAYAEGAQPVNSEEEDFETPLSAGELGNKSTSFEGVLPIYATTVNVATVTQQGLKSMLTGNNIAITLADEGDGSSKQSFELPNLWLNDRPLAKVEFYNTVSDSWDSTNQLNTFSTSQITKTINGVSRSYTKYTNAGADRDSLQIRLKF
tara:strand:+ start:12485 stop:13444 length:960 start_codon:yes stop_codon:yes gene_type:complete